MSNASRFQERMRELLIILVENEWVSGKGCSSVCPTGAQCGNIFADILPQLISSYPDSSWNVMLLLQVVNNGVKRGLLIPCNGNDYTNISFNNNMAKVNGVTQIFLNDDQLRPELCLPLKGPHDGFEGRCTSSVYFRTTGCPPGSMPSSTAGVLGGGISRPSNKCIPFEELFDIEFEDLRLRGVLPDALVNNDISNQAIELACLLKRVLYPNNITSCEELYNSQ